MVCRGTQRRDQRSTNTAPKPPDDFGLGVTVARDENCQPAVVGASGWATRGVGGGGGPAHGLPSKVTGRAAGAVVAGAACSISAWAGDGPWPIT
jgi:hypothetical protein